MIQKEALNTDAEYHTETSQSSQYVDILVVTYVTLGRMIWQKQSFMRLLISY